MGKRRTKGSSLDVALFWMMVKPSTEFHRLGRCWLWTGAKIPSGYGHITRNQKQVLSHRYAWELVHGPVPKNMCVLHKCDNPACVRPSHMFIGDHEENMRDMARKGRNPGNGNLRGETHGCHKLTEIQVREIRSLALEGKISQRGIAKMFCVTQSAVSVIHKRKAWRHI